MSTYLFDKFGIVGDYRWGNRASVCESFADMLPMGGLCGREASWGVAELFGAPDVTGHEGVEKGSSDASIAMRGKNPSSHACILANWMGSLCPSGVVDDAGQEKPDARIFLNPLS